MPRLLLCKRNKPFVETWKNFEESLIYEKYRCWWYLSNPKRPLFDKIQIGRPTSAGTCIFWTPFCWQDGWAFGSVKLSILAGFMVWGYLYKQEKVSFPMVSWYLQLTHFVAPQGPNDFKFAFNLAIFPCPLFPKLKAQGAKKNSWFVVISPWTPL